jgi:hypothetical protein
MAALSFLISAAIATEAQQSPTRAHRHGIATSASALLGITDRGASCISTIEMSWQQ